MDEEELRRKLKLIEDVEEWRVVPSSPNYEVSDQGRVRRTTKSDRGGLSYVGKILKTPLGGENRGHPVVNLNGILTKPVSHLVAEAFLGPRLPDQDVHHKDHDATNDWAYNLEYMEHAKHGGLHGLAQC